MRKNRNITIDIFRFYCALLVVTIHTNLFVENNGTIYVLWQTIARMAVPFFFTVTGIYLGNSIALRIKKW